jgi:hypothetical protein
MSLEQQIKDLEVRIDELSMRYEKDPTRWNEIVLECTMHSYEAKLRLLARE